MPTLPTVCLPEKPRSAAPYEHRYTPAVDVPILLTPDKIKDGPNIFTCATIYTRHIIMGIW